MSPALAGRLSTAVPPGKPQQILLDLALFGGDEGNFREKNILVQWILVLLIEVCIYESYCVSHTFSLIFKMGRKLSSEVVTEYNYS